MLSDYAKGALADPQPLIAAAREAAEAEKAAALAQAEAAHARRLEEVQAETASTVQSQAGAAQALVRI